MLSVNERTQNNYPELLETGKLLPLKTYDKIIVAFSGGKDCTAALLHLLDMGVDRSQLELWHHHVDGVDGEQFMDWPCTESYVRALAKALNVKVRFQWKDKGFLGEMLRLNQRTNGVYYEDGEGKVCYLPPGAKSKPSTRRMFPQTTADLSVRWCSAYLKIDVCKRVLNNDPRFERAKVLLITGERREESTARSKYNEVDRHACTNQKRRVDQWRTVIDWSEKEVWDAFRRWKLIGHPAYYLGWGRVSCMTCIFGNADQWASVRKIAPKNFERITNFETEFGKTIKKGLTVLDQANNGKVYAECSDQNAVQLALSLQYPENRIFVPHGEEWTLPAGAFRHCGGPI